MSTIKADGIQAATGTNTDLTLAGKGTGVPDLAAGYKVNGTVEKLTGIAPGSSGNLLTSDGTDWTSAAAAGGGKVLQIVTTQTGAVATGTTVIPDDDTIPQITEGVEYMTRSITPAASGNRLRIEVTVFAGMSGNGHTLCVALFQDTTAGALAGGFNENQNAANKLVPLTFAYEMAAGTTSSTTFRVRIGSDQAGTTTFNGVGGGRKFGGVMASSITITEFET